MTAKDIIAMYQKLQKKYGKDAYKYVSELFIDAKKSHKKDFTGKDHDQSLLSFKGKSLEKLIKYIIIDAIRSIGLEAINGNALERRVGTNLTDIQSKVKRNLLVDYGKLGCHLPDVDIIVFHPTTSEIIAVLSVKATLRERISQTGYWKLKLAADKYTRHIKVLFVTPDEDGVFQERKQISKSRAIAEVELDGSYILTKDVAQLSNKVKMFDQLIPDLKKLAKK